MPTALEMNHRAQPLSNNSNNDNPTFIRELVLRQNSSQAGPQEVTLRVTGAHRVLVTAASRDLQFIKGLTLIGNGRWRGL